MTGYREHGFDPNAYDRPGPPLRPYNWVQWTGFAIMVAGLLLAFAYFLGKLGLVPQWPGDSSPLPFAAILLGTVLVNSRRAEPTELTPEEQARGRRTLVITAIVCTITLAAVAAIDLYGAN